MVIDIVERLAQWAENDMKAEAIALEAKHEIERLRETLQEIADAKISGVIGDGYNVRDWLIRHHVILVNKAREALGEADL